jgi:hypothetical protein
VCVLQECYRDVAGMLQACRGSVTKVLKGGNDGDDHNHDKAKHVLRAPAALIVTRCRENCTELSTQPKFSMCSFSSRHNEASTKRRPRGGMQRKRTQTREQMKRARASHKASVCEKEKERGGGRGVGGEKAVDLEGVQRLHATVVPQIYLHTRSHELVKRRGVSAFRKN